MSSGVGRMLLRERKSAGLTQTQVGRRIGRSKQWVSLVEKGDQVPKMELTLAWLVACDKEGYSDISPTEALDAVRSLREDTATVLAVAIAVHRHPELADSIRIHADSLRKSRDPVH